MLKLISFLKGYLTITVTGSFPERFINVCAAKNILLWDIKRVSERSIRCKISVRAFRRLVPISYNTGVRVKICTRHGLVFLLQKYKKRKIAIASVFILVLFMVIANQFVWDIEVTGNETVKTKDILSVLEEEGLVRGIPKAKIDQQHLKNRAILKLPALSWLWIDKRGSKIVVDVRERVPVPEIFDPDTYTNIVAAKDAVIDEMVVRNGIPVVKSGDTVLAGTVLVTGKIPSALKPEIRYENAEAQIYGRVWYEKTKTFSKISTIRTETGKKKVRFSLTAFGKEIPLFHNGKPPFENSDEKIKKYDLSIFGNYLGLTLTTHTYREVTVEKKLHTTKSTAAQGANTLKEQIDNGTLPDSFLISVSDSYKELDETTVEVTVCAEYKENIAQKKKGELVTPAPEEDDTSSTGT